MILRGIEFPYTHDLSRLLTMLGSSGEKLSQKVRQAVTLTRYAGILRYPVFDESVPEQAYEGAMAIAEEVVLWAEEITGYTAIGNET